MWLLLASTILFCLAPGSMPLTYNGVNSSSTVTIGTNTQNNSVSFKLRTRQVNALLFTTGDSNNNFTAYINNNGAVSFSGKYGSAVSAVSYEGSK